MDEDEDGAGSEAGSERLDLREEIRMMQKSEDQQQHLDQQEYDPTAPDTTEILTLQNLKSMLYEELLDALMTTTNEGSMKIEYVLNHFNYSI